MKAALFTDPRKVVLREVPTPVPADGEVLIRVGACGICGSEIPFYLGEPDPYCSFPCTLGHEIAGTVAEIGGRDDRLEVGDKVVPEITVSCGACYACRIGKYNCCANLKIIGAHLSGGFAEYVLVPARLCHKLPDDMDLAVAALCEPYSIGSQVVARSAVTRTDSVLVQGAGAIGLTVLDQARNTGARVMVSDIHGPRLERARRFGADAVVDAANEDLLDRVMRFTDGDGVSIAIDATGAAKAINDLPGLVASGGRMTVVGITPDDVRIRGTELIRKELTLFGSRNSMNLFPSVIDAVYAGRVHAKELITDRFGLAEIAAAFEHAVSNYRDIGKVLIEV